MLLINGAIGGTQFSDWLGDRSGYYDALMGRLGAARAAGYAPDLVLWHQGETDAAVQRDLLALRGDLDRLLVRLRRDVLEAPVYFFQASRCMGPGRTAGFPDAVAAMRETAARIEGVIVGMNTDELGRDFRWDTCHFNSRGRAAIVEWVLPEVIEIVGAAP